ncbi:MAG: hypothetical protein OXB92_00310 [Acidimicrobiaceae bacterium]|nr:hypothetical protein [Acidimicrobiaceae bacterium]
MDSAALVHHESAILNMPNRSSALQRGVKKRSNSDRAGVKTSLRSAFRDTQSSKP